MQLRQGLPAQSSAAATTPHSQRPHLAPCPPGATARPWVSRAAHPPPQLPQPPGGWRGARGCRGPRPPRSRCRHRAPPPHAQSRRGRAPRACQSQGGTHQRRACGPPPKTLQQASGMAGQASSAAVVQLPSGSHTATCCAQEACRWPPCCPARTFVRAAIPPGEDSNAVLVPFPPLAVVALPWQQQQQQQRQDTERAHLQPHTSPSIPARQGESTHARATPHSKHPLGAHPSAT